MVDLLCFPCRSLYCGVGRSGADFVSYAAGVGTGNYRGAEEAFAVDCFRTEPKWKVVKRFVYEEEPYLSLGSHIFL